MTTCSQTKKFLIVHQTLDNHRISRPKQDLKVAMDETQQHDKIGLNEGEIEDEPLCHESVAEDALDLDQSDEIRCIGRVT